MQVPAAAALVRVGRPRDPAERRAPVVGRAVAAGPDVPVGMVAKPRVLDRGVAGDEVHQELEPALVGCPRAVNRILGENHRIVVSERDAVAADTSRRIRHFDG